MIQGMQMAQRYVLFWRDIPAQVVVQKSRREQCKKVLNTRFEKAIDRAAMKSGKDSDDDYLALWRKSTPEECSDALEQEANQYAQELEIIYTPEKLRILVQNGGTQPNSNSTS